MVTGSCQRGEVDRFDAGPQPAGRPPAPGRLGYVQAFLNSFWDLERHGAERWTTPAAYDAWLGERGFAPIASAADLQRALAVREALRALCLANHATAERPEPEPEAGVGAWRRGVLRPEEALAVLGHEGAAIAPGAALAPRLTAHGDRLEPAGDGPDAAVGLALAVVLAARADGSWGRLKACPHAHCGWAFHDASRNRSAQWCSMRLCGNRAKGAAFRRRTPR
jgi:hypothetical protein